MELMAVFWHLMAKGFLPRRHAATRGMPIGFASAVLSHHFRGARWSVPGTRSGDAGAGHIHSRTSTGITVSDAFAEDAARGDSDFKPSGIRGISDAISVYQDTRDDS